MHPFLSQTNDEFKKQFHGITNESSRYAREIYDAVWAMNLAIRQSEILQNVRLSDFTYKRDDMVASFVESMQSLNFLGMSVSTAGNFGEIKIFLYASGACQFRRKR